MNNFYQPAKKLTKTLLYYTIKFDVFIVYAFSRTILSFVWILIIILGLFYGDNISIVNIYCLLAVMYIIGTSTLLWIVCITKKTRKLMEDIVGLPFLEKFAPKKGFSNFLRICLPFYILLFLDTVSVEYIVSAQLQECEAQSLLAREYFEKGDFIQADITRNNYLRILESLSNTKGIVRQLSSHSYFIYIVDCISKMLGI